uniref:Peptidase M50 domain-containing protein n=1 Tax=Calcidiscus leptoporus TaxID=127549 RepID=A0A7S0NP46_9EUKA|mmetsp:Transcript_12098/g.28059  ORF Transcript_12098/g.28059 Transcript_12098/m.28059 type:complete len:607 (+) Transcript_12098:15-1835(+)
MANPSSNPSMSSGSFLAWVAVLLSLVACTSGYATPVWRRAPRLGSRSPCVHACDREKKEVSEGAVTTAQLKRLRADRLALQAERAALELEELELRAQQLQLEVAKRRPREDDAPTTPASPLPRLAEPTADEAAGEASSSSLNVLVSAVNGSDAQQAPTAASSALGASVAKALSDSRTEALHLSDRQVEAARARVFDIQSFYVTAVERSPVGTIFRGNLRANASFAFHRVAERVAAEPELADVLFLLVQDPSALTVDDVQSGKERQPIFLAIPAEASKMPQSARDIVAAVLGLVTTAITTLGFALSAYILSDGGEMLAKLQEGDPAPVQMAIPLAAALGGMQLLHEVAHLAAARVHGVRTGIPIFLPSLQLGLFGAITQIRSFPRSRTALFDFAFAGPCFSGCVGLGLYVVGLLLSIDLPVPPPTAVLDASFSASTVAASAATAVSSGTTDLMPVVPSALLQSSLLLGSAAQAVLPAVATAPAVTVHPLVIVGFTATIVNALQLLPIGSLDGGRIAAAVLGQNANLLSAIALLSLGLSTLVGGDNPILLFFGLLTIFLQRAPERPCADDVSPVSSRRAAAASAAALLGLLVLLPCPYVPEAGQALGF